VCNFGLRFQVHDHARFRSLPKLQDDLD